MALTLTQQFLNLMEINPNFILCNIIYNDSGKLYLYRVTKGEIPDKVIKNIVKLNFSCLYCHNLITLYFTKLHELNELSCVFCDIREELNKAKYTY